MERCLVLHSTLLCTGLTCVLCPVVFLVCHSVLLWCGVLCCLVSHCFALCWYVSCCRVDFFQVGVSSFVLCCVLCHVVLCHCVVLCCVALCCVVLYMRVAPVISHG